VRWTSSNDGQKLVEKDAVLKVFFEVVNAPLFGTAEIVFWMGHAGYKKP
jgi:hypothetical protein